MWYRVSSTNKEVDCGDNTMLFLSYASEDRGKASILSQRNFVIVAYASFQVGPRHLCRGRLRPGDSCCAATLCAGRHSLVPSLRQEGLDHLRSSDFLDLACATYP